MPRRARPAGLPVGWEAVVEARFAPWPILDSGERTVVSEIADHLLRTIRWEAARGFELTDDMRVTLAAHAAYPLLTLGPDPYRRVRAVVVHANTVPRHGSRSGPVKGTQIARPGPASGESYDHGSVVLAWRAALADALNPDRGRNLVIHEFAHQIDALDGTLDGAPPADAEWLGRWEQIRTVVEQRIRDEPHPSLRTYALTNAIEFFAVATETFFTTPTALRDSAPDLYGCLAEWFRQDPAARTAT